MNVAQHPHAASMPEPMPPPPGPPNGAYGHHLVPSQSPVQQQQGPPPPNKMELMGAIPLQQHPQHQQHMQQQQQQQQQQPQQQQQQQQPQQQPGQQQGGPPGQPGPQPGRACERCRKTGRTCEPREGALACVGCNASRVACSLVGEIQGTTGTRRASPTKRPTNNHASASNSGNTKKRARSSTGGDGWDEDADPQQQHGLPAHPLAPVPNMADPNAAAAMAAALANMQHPKRRRTDDAEDTDIEEIREVIRDINSMHNEIGRKLTRLTKLWERKYGQAP